MARKFDRGRIVFILAQQPGDRPSGMPAFGVPIFTQRPSIEEAAILILENLPFALSLSKGEQASTSSA
ncbi:MAG: hypothetical protein AAFY26_23445 [Cyanobacteria bacterium J06638_22]